MCELPKFNRREDLFGEENKIAEEYDLLKMAVPHHDEFQEQIGIELATHFSSDQTPNILELGSGTGITTKEIVKVVPMAKITALDLEAGMQEQAKLKKISNSINYITADAYEYIKSLEDNSLDGLVTAYTLHNFKKEYRGRLVKEMYRVIKPGGVFINADKFAHSNDEEYRKAYSEQIARYDVFDEIGKSDLKKEWIEHYAVDNQDDLRLVDSDFESLLQEVGFVGVKLTWRILLEAVMVAKKPKS